MPRIPNVTNISERVPSLSSINLTDENSFIALGAGGDIRVTREVGGKSLNLSNQVTDDDNPSILTLQSHESAIEENDVIGALNFQAKGESSVFDSVLVCAGIEAIAENDFSASSNATKLSFKLGSSEIAGEKMSLSSTGVLAATGFAGALTGNADTATALETSRTIGGVSFNGTANIDLPGVNAAGNQNTSGTAATATLAATTSNVNVSDESSDTSCNVLFTTGATGNLPPKSGTNLTFNSSTGILSVTGLDVSGPIKKHTTTIASSRSITVSDTGVTLNMAAANPAGTSVVLTLPPATGTGHHYVFICTVVNAMTNGYKFVVDAGTSDKFHGFAHSHNGNSGNLDSYKITTHSVINMNGTTTGGQVGDRITFVDIASAIFHVDATLSTPSRTDTAHPAS